MDDSLGYYPPAKKAARQEQQAKLKLMRELLSLSTEELFEGALRLQGIKEGSDEWKTALSAWREYQARRL